MEDVIMSFAFKSPEKNIVQNFSKKSKNFRIKAIRLNQNNCKIDSEETINKEKQQKNVA